MSATAIAPLVHRPLLDPVIWDRLVSDLVAKDGLDLDVAQEALDQCLGFLSVPEPGYSPSEIVDLAWHRFKSTPEYGPFCLRVVERFVHHREGAWTRDGAQAMRHYGLPVIERVWQRPADCSTYDCRTDWD